MTTNFNPNSKTAALQELYIYYQRNVHKSSIKGILQFPVFVHYLQLYVQSIGWDFDVFLDMLTNNIHARDKSNNKNWKS